MDTFKNIRAKVGRSSLTPYFITIILTLIIGWFLFRKTDPDVVITEKHDMVIEKMQAIGKLELVKMNVKDIMNYKVEVTGPDVDYLMLVSGDITGCIDLTKLNKDQISESDSSITIILPEPEICYAKIDLDKTKLYNLNNIPLISSLAGNQQELTEMMYKKAENYLSNDSLRDVAINQCRKNAVSVLGPMLESISKKKINLSFNKKAIRN